MSDDTIGKWCYSINEEDYYGKYDTEDEAHGNACQALEEDERDPGPNSYWIAKCCNPLDRIRADYLADRIEEQLDEWMGDEVNADDYILTIAKEDKERLGQLVIEFVRKHGSINYYSVKNIKAHTHVVPEEG